MNFYRETEDGVLDIDVWEDEGYVCMRVNDMPEAWRGKHPYPTKPIVKCENAGVYSECYPDINKDNDNNVRIYLWGRWPQDNDVARAGDVDFDIVAATLKELVNKFSPPILPRI